MKMAMTTYRFYINRCTECLTRHHLILWQIVLSFFIFHLSFSPVGAQTFTQRIQQKGQAGEGTVTVSQSKDIDDLVNGKLTESLPETKPDDKPVADKPESVKAREQLAKILEHKSDSTAIETTIDTRKKVMRGGYKIDGYRVQAFAGGNQRKDRQKAEQIGSKIKNSFPTEPIYVHFYSPRWICRVGNYRTYEEAYQMLKEIRKLGISGASIVKGKITVQY